MDHALLSEALLRSIVRRVLSKFSNTSVVIIETTSRISTALTGFPRETGGLGCQRPA
jgi:hypothetical protein